VQNSSLAARDHTISYARSQLEGLNSLRGLAAILVVVVHVWGINPLPESYGTGFIKVYFPLGVALFFVISAFSLCVSTLHRVGGDGWLSAFAIRRFMRIAPLFYLMSLFYLLVVPTIVGGPLPWAHFFVTISFLFNLMPGQHASLVWAGWTIGVEMLFYMVLPLVLVFVGGLRGAGIILILATVLSCAFIVHYQTPAYPSYYADLSFMGSLGIFAWGIFAYFVYQKLLLSNRAAVIGTVILMLSVLGGAFLVLTDGRFFHLPMTRALLWAPVFAGLVLSQCIHPTTVVTNRLMSHLGMLSFSLYLCHPPIIYFLYPIFLGIYDLVAVDEAALLVCVILTLALLYPTARVAFVLVERPGIQLGERIIRRRLFRDNVVEPRITEGGRCAVEAPLLSGEHLNVGAATLTPIDSEKSAALGQ
jgi:peptidoglycan/LPS O-acetylase OafA/YrhL